MSKWGNFDFSQFERMTEALKNTVDSNALDRFMHDFLLEMAYRAERKIKKRTPVDTGELRRNWKVGKVERQGDNYIIEIYNNTEYASFVENGHRSGPELKGWTEGRFMMTISMKEIEKELPIYLERRMTKLLNDVLNGRVPKKGGGERLE